MITTDERHGRTASDLLRFLPLALIITMFGLAVLIHQVSPSQVTSGVYQVNVGEGAGQFRLTTDSLTCSRNSNTTTCTAPVAGQQLTINVTYPNPAAMWNSTCAARHGDRPVPCSREVIYIDEAPAVSVWIPDQLGVTEPELTRLRDAEPWWLTGAGPSIADLAPFCGFTGAVAGVTAYLLNRRTRPQPTPWRNQLAAGTGFLGLALPITGILVITSIDTIEILPMLIFTPAATISAAMGAWQYQLLGAGGYGRARRWVYAIGAAIVTVLYTAMAVILLILLFTADLD